jgi:hypothetical protein
MATPGLGWIKYFLTYSTSIYSPIPPGNSSLDFKLQTIKQHVITHILTISADVAAGDESMKVGTW